MLGGHVAEIKVASELCNLSVAQRTNVVVDGVVIKQSGTQKYICRGSDFGCDINVFTICAAWTFKFVGRCFGVGDKCFGTAWTKLSGV